MVQYEGAGLTDRRFLHADERGSIIAATNGSGAAIHVNSYDEYGIPGSQNVGRFQYTGQAWLPELGMYHYKTRIYSPTLGRFLQTDPIGYEDQVNLYAYVRNDPINFIDPTGEETRCAADMSSCVTTIVGEPQPTAGDPIVAGTRNSQNGFDRANVATPPAIMQSGAEIANIGGPQSGNERGYRMDISSPQEGITIVTATEIRGQGTGSTFNFDPAEG